MPRSRGPRKRPAAAPAASSGTDSVLLARIDDVVKLLLLVACGDVAFADADDDYRTRVGRVRASLADTGIDDPFVALSSIWQWSALVGGELTEAAAAEAYLVDLTRPARQAIAGVLKREPDYAIETYERGGNPNDLPFETWMEELSKVKQIALDRALNLVLAYEGSGVVSGEWGKNLGAGLLEFRIRRTAQEVEQLFRDRVGERQDLPAEGEDVLLRVYFHAHGGKLILLLGGFDKGEHPNWEDTQIAEARARLKDWKEQQKRRAKARRTSKA